MMVQVRQLELWLNIRAVLSHLNWSLESGQLLVILGENGCGKTSLLHALAQAEPERLHWRQGTPLWPEVYLPHFRSLARQHILAMPGLEVRDVLALVSRNAQEVLFRWGLVELAQRRTEQLSCGQLQRLEIARSFAQLQGNNGVWMLDEPFSMLDVRWQQHLVRSLEEHCTAGGSVILSLHNLTLARRLATQVLFLGQGRQLAHGLPHLLNDRDLLQRVYGCELMFPFEE